MHCQRKDFYQAECIFRSETFSTWWSVLILAYVFLVFLLVHVMDQRLPAPLTVKDAATNPEAFIEERARQYLKQLTSVGPRPAGRIRANAIYQAT